ncbi:Myc-type, basic helix-loop-helix (bHLH) domain containing protein [Parasponia andersonii]|uniref:Myc-type, basic helix-loop-helix (BHLH) domain containing protein n=1 Tax=Parasponia andersonii TaxID=3476 RepID=A0A2P5E0U0_PARAD|nr:Myc-type, basic helix-loop-helix (bHLH) domain containing protein [Parasponia andersonii]
MAEECAESSVATSSSCAVVPPCNNWWDLHAVGSSALSSWCHNNNNNGSDNIPWHNIQATAAPNPNSNSDEDVSISTSFTNASNHSGLTVESSRRLVEPAASSSDDLIAEQQAASDNHIWSHVLLNVGNNGDLHNHQDVGENFLDMLSSSKNNISTSGMYEPACDYLKKLDSSNSNWDNNQFSNNFDDQKPIIHNSATFNESMIENERLTNKLSSLISTWSIAPPEPLELNNINTSSTTNRHYFNPQTCSISLNSSMDHHLKQTFGYSEASLFPPCNYIPSLKIKNGHGGGEIEASCPATAGALLRRSFNGASNIGAIGYQVGLDSSFMAADHNGKYHYGVPAPAPGPGTGPVDSYSSCNGTSTTAKNLADVISFGGRLGKPMIDIHASNNKPCINKSLGLSDSKKQGLQTSTPTRGSGRGQANTSSEGKKKRSEDTTSETNLKKPKQENSTASSAKMQAPKVKLGDRITALQQIVSPFGKTDTASVLYEAIQYIKFLQEQVQLLSNPYMKTNSHKDPWGSLDRNKDHHMKGDHAKLDLRSRGLCLVPLSCTPQVYRENTGSDYWTPTYRGCLYR